ncbi:MAG TPA: hypothetical protein VK253_08910 [Candidatus Binatia bacterium]|nr:hypothetical protein [Candidatus Binatia bacterium]
MKTNRKAVLVFLMVMSVVLTVISASEFVTATINTAPTASGTNRYYNQMSGGNMMGNMMGGNLGSNPSSTPTPVANTAQNSILPIVGFVALIGAALAGIGGAVYYFTGRPKITSNQPTLNSTVNTPMISVETPIDSVAKTLTVEERRVVDILTAHNGQYLQKYIRSETGLSRLKIHRIVSRLAERGIVTLEQSGNTNRVILSNWLNEKPFTKIQPTGNSNREIVVSA